VKIRLMAAAGCGAVGLAVLVALSGRVTPVPSAGFRADHEESVRRAREIAHDFGVDTTVWHSGSMSFLDNRLQFWIHRSAAQSSPGSIERMVTPLTSKVGFAAPSGSEKLFLTLTSHGDLLRLLRKDAPPLKEPPANPKEIALHAFRALARDHAAAFRLTTDGAPAPGVTQYSWEADSSHPEDLTFSIRVTVGQEGVREASLTPNLTRRASEAFVRQKASEDAAAGIIVVFGLAVVGTSLALFAWGWFRGTLDRGAAIAVGAVYFLSKILINVFGSGSQRYLADEDLARFSAIGLTVELVIFSIASMALVGAGESLSRRGGRQRWHSFLLLLRGGFSFRQPAFSIFCGVLLGILMKAAAQATAWISPLFEWDQPSLESLSSPAPWLEPLLPPVPLGWLALFCLVLPLMEHRLPLRRVRTPLALLIVIVGVFSKAPFTAALGASALWAVAVGAICYAVYRGWDLLTLLAAVFVFRVLEQSLALSVTESEALRFSAQLGFLLIGAVFASSGFVLWKGRDAQLEELDASNAEPVSQRERLKSEFSTAREAQLRMLPAQPPDIAGFELAGMCHPARDVGGDLFDYARLPDGRHVICVADVSGKGMSAALYMTLTKGVLTAAVEGSDDLAEIAGQLNGHIYAAGRRRIFVTAALGALDPQTRVMEYARAGHNPIVWRSPSRGFTRLVQPNGMGLGVGPVAIFNRTLELDRLDLLPGDTLVFYSDGVTEAMDEVNEQFGEERLMASVDAAGDIPAQAVQEKILVDLSAFLKGSSPQDDATIVVLRALPLESGVDDAATLGENSSQSGDGKLG